MPYLAWMGIGLAGYAASTVLYTLALSMSHKAAFSIRKSIRQRILEKLPKLPLGTVMDMSSGKMRQTIVNQVDGMETTLEMNGTIVEYIGGIEVIKAFNQGKSSYAKFADRVKANAAYYYNWMKKSQFGISTAFSIVPAALITILPVGWLLYRGGSLPVETFVTVIILSRGYLCDAYGLT